MEFKYKLLNISDLEAATKCIAKSFFKNDIISVALGINFKDWNNFASKEVKKSIDSKLSFGAFNLENIVGIHLCYDFDIYNANNYNIVKSFSPISVLMNSLYGGYIPSEKILHFSYVGVASNYLRNGIAYEMALKNIELAKEKKFKKIISEATSLYSQKNLSMLGFKKINEIFYSDFEYKGKMIFNKITKTLSCTLMERRL